ncbi:hypothetical protein like AT3G59200 [Hibiscus trionum]|uniref:F-box domain-containing protein n=1 Tax=Hibiscus trionum TaxID=183268 RepID=A0A9W7MST4_HIBTR|nr:hypothetical protein like AT3G59200 [Hibiscus trionum]
MAKKVKSAGELDRISSLPDPILCHILSFSPTKDAVRTSILSRRWRYLFASMPTLDFYSCLRDLPRRNVNNFWGFVDRLLFFPNRVSLECFRLHDPTSKDDDHLRLYDCISAALWRGAKEIVIYSRNCPVFPTLLFTSQSLMVLKLNIEGEMKIPADVCLPNLKTLHLTNLVFVVGSSILRLISSCHVLEDLVLDLCDFHNISVLSIHSLSLKRLGLSFLEMVVGSPGDLNCAVEINTPNLVYLRCTELIAEGYTFSNMSSLEKAHISIYPVNRDATDNVDRIRGVTNLFQAIRNVQDLSLFTDNAETLFGTCLEPGLAFPNLVELEFGNPNGDWKGTWIMEFLCCMPNLKKLILDLGVPEEGFRVVPEKVPSCVLFHLKEIEVPSFEGDKHMFAMISYLLNHGRVLEKLIIDVYDPCEERRLSLIEELLRLPRNSKKCDVEIL